MIAKTKTSLLVALVAVAALSACSKEPVTPEAKAEAAATKAAGTSSDDKPREATYDPNLKPAEIVWDSPEKKKAWEARQAELKAAAAKK